MNVDDYVCLPVSQCLPLFVLLSVFSLCFCLSLCPLCVSLSLSLCVSFVSDSVISVSWCRLYICSIPISWSMPVCLPLCFSFSLSLRSCFYVTIVAVSQSRTLTGVEGETRILRPERALETGQSQNPCWMLAGFREWDRMSQISVSP